MYGYILNCQPAFYLTKSTGVITLVTFPIHS